MSRRPVARPAPTPKTSRPGGWLKHPGAQWPQRSGRRKRPGSCEGVVVTPFCGAHVLGEYVYPVYAPFGVGGGISTTKTRKHTHLLVSLTASHVVGHRPLGTGAGKDGRPRRSQLQPTTGANSRPNLRGLISMRTPTTDSIKFPNVPEAKSG